MIFQEERLSDAGLPTVVVPLTTQRRKGLEALRIAVPARERLLQDCYAMAEQVRAIDRARIGEGPLAKLDAARLAAVERAIRGVMGMS